MDEGGNAEMKMNYEEFHLTASFTAMLPVSSLSALIRSMPSYRYPLSSALNSGAGILPVPTGREADSKSEAGNTC